MIDIHCHMLPGIDDGPADLESSLRMARMAHADGITHIVASPHYSYGERPSASDIREALQRFSGTMKDQMIGLTVLQGADIRLTFELFSGLGNRDIPAINGSRYFLLELPDLMPPNVETFIFRARTEGYIPVITHPERNYSLLMSTDKLLSLRDSGALFQVTAMSITGEFGEQIQRYSRMMLRKGYVDFVATDAHNTDFRVPVLSRAYREVSELLGDAACSSIFFNNPEAVIEDRDLP
jgi:protein-tyrosine phosphatase